MILLHIINLISASYREFYEGVQDTIINKYRRKEFESIDLREKTLLINISLFDQGSSWKERFIGEGEQSKANGIIFNFLNAPNNKLYIIYGNKIVCSLQEFIKRKFKDRNIDYEIVYNISAYSLTKIQKKTLNIFMKELKDYHKNHRIRILLDTNLLMMAFETRRFSSEIVCRSDDIIINFIFIRKSRLYCFNINFEEFKFKKYFIEILRDHEFSNLSDENLLKKLFKDFKFSFYSIYYNSTEVYDKFIDKTSKQESEYEITPYIFDKKFSYTFYEDYLDLNGIIYSSSPSNNRNISKKMFDEMKQFFSFSLNLKNDDLLSVGLLYYTLTDDMKLLIINKIMESYYSPYAIIFFHILRCVTFITQNEFQNIMALNYSLRSMEDDPYKKHVLKMAYDNLFETRIKNLILGLRPCPELSNCNYLMILFAKVVNEIYLSDDYDTKKFEWKTLYDEILEKLHLPRDENSAFNIFKHVLLDLENVLYILQYEQTAIVDMLTHLTKNPPLIYNYHNFQFKLIEYKKMLQKENLEDLPIKDELYDILN